MQIESQTKTELVITTSLVEDEEHFDEQLLFGEPSPEEYELGEHAVIEHLRSVVAVPEKHDDATGITINALHAVTREPDGHVDHYVPEAKAVIEAAHKFFSEARAIASNVHGRTHFVDEDGVPLDRVTVTLKAS